MFVGVFDHQDGVFTKGWGGGQGIQQIGIGPSYPATVNLGNELQYLSIQASKWSEYTQNIAFLDVYKIVSIDINNTHIYI